MACIECSLELVQQRLVLFKTPACPWLFSTHHTHVRTHYTVHTHAVKFTHTRACPHCSALYTCIFSLHHSHCSVTHSTNNQFNPPSPRALFNPHTLHHNHAVQSSLHTLFIHHTQPSTHFHCPNATMLHCMVCRCALGIDDNSLTASAS